MQALHDRTVRVNSGHAWEMKKGQRVRITFQSIVDFVVFNLNNLQGDSIRPEPRPTRARSIRARATSCSPRRTLP